MVKRRERGREKERGRGESRGEFFPPVSPLSTAQKRKGKQRGKKNLPPPSQTHRKKVPPRLPRRRPGEKRLGAPRGTVEQDPGGRGHAQERRVPRSGRGGVGVGGGGRARRVGGGGGGGAPARRLERLLEPGLGGPLPPDVSPPRPREPEHDGPHRRGAHDPPGGVEVAPGDNEVRGVWVDGGGRRRRARRRGAAPSSPAVAAAAAAAPPRGLLGAAHRPPERHARGLPHEQGQVGPHEPVRGVREAADVPVGQRVPPQRPGGVARGRGRGRRGRGRGRRGRARAAAEVRAEDRGARLGARGRHLELGVQPAGPPQRLVDGLEPVGGGEDDDAARRGGGGDGVELGGERAGEARRGARGRGRRRCGGDGPAARAPCPSPSSSSSPSRRGQRVDLVQEHHRGPRSGPRGREDAAEPRLRRPGGGPHDLRAADDKQRDGGPAAALSALPDLLFQGQRRVRRGSDGQRRLSRSRGTVEHRARGSPEAEEREGFRPAQGERDEAAEALGEGVDAAQGREAAGDRARRRSGSEQGPAESPRPGCRGGRGSARGGAGGAASDRPFGRLGRGRGGCRDEGIFVAAVVESGRRGDCCRVLVFFAFAFAFAFAVVVVIAAAAVSSARSDDPNLRPRPNPRCLPARKRAPRSVRAGTYDDDPHDLEGRVPAQERDREDVATQEAAARSAPGGERRERGQLPRSRVLFFFLLFLQGPEDEF